MTKQTKEKLFIFINYCALVFYPLFALLNFFHTKLFFRHKYKNGLSGMLRTKNDILDIEECINSCLPALDELIVYDNGSTDGTYEKVLELAEQNPKIKVYQYLNNKGWYVKKLCNKCLRKTRYKYITKIDGDQIYNTKELIRIKNELVRDDKYLILMSGLNVYRNKNNRPVITSKLKEGGDYLFNGYLDHFVFKKTIFTMFIKYKNWRKIEFLLVPYMGTKLRPYKKYNHIMWIHSRQTKYHKQLTKYFELKDLAHLPKSFFEVDDPSYLDYQLDFFVKKSKDTYKLDNNIIKDMQYWFDNINKTNYIKKRVKK